jgi:hypothetical protein
LAAFPEFLWALGVKSSARGQKEARIQPDKMRQILKGAAKNCHITPVNIFPVLYFDLNHGENAITVAILRGITKNEKPVEVHTVEP